MNTLKQIGGSHYGGSDFQHWDMVIECGTDYLAAVATKYLRRWRDKGGIQDVQKAVQYVDKIIFALTFVEHFKPSGDPDKVSANMARYVEINKLPQLESEASRILFGWRNLTDLYEARAIMIQIIQAEVCSWPEMASLMDKIKPDAWQGYTFEGAKENRFWFRCVLCRVRFDVAVNAPPMFSHECGANPTRGYVAQ